MDQDNLQTPPAAGPDAGAAPETGSQSGSPEAEPVLNHDGIGLDLEQVRKIIVNTHGEAIGKDDPILMTVTIFNAFIGELAKVNERHHQALLGVMSASTDKYITEVKGSVDSLTKELSGASANAIQAAMQQDADARLEFGRDLKWTAAIITISALLNIAVFILQ